MQLFRRLLRRIMPGDVGAEQQPGFIHQLLFIFIPCRLLLYQVMDVTHHMKRCAGNQWLVTGMLLFCFFYNKME